jgi:hypothetical protein
MDTGRFGRQWDDNIKMDLEEIGWVNTDLSEVVQGSL